MNFISCLINRLFDATVNRERQYTIMLLGDKVTRHVDLVARPTDKVRIQSFRLDGSHHSMLNCAECQADQAQQAVNILERCGRYVTDIHLKPKGISVGGV